MAEKLPVHMSDDEEIINNESDVSELSDNEEEIEYNSVSETSLDSNFDEEDGKFLALLVVLQQLLIPSQQQPCLHPRLYYSNWNQTRWNIRPPALPAIVSNVVYQGTQKEQTSEVEIESWELFFNNAMLESITDFTNIKIGSLESITDFTNIKIGLLRYIFQRDRDTKETDVAEIRMLFGLLYMAGMMGESHMNINDFYRTNGIGVEFFHPVMPKNCFGF